MLNLQESIHESQILSRVFVYTLLHFQSQIVYICEDDKYITENILQNDSHYFDNITIIYFLM